MSVVDTYQYPDLEDAFSREPFVVKFSAPGSGEVPPRQLPAGAAAPPPPRPRFLPLTRASRSCGGVRAHPAARGAAPGRIGDRRSLRRVPGRDRQVGHGRKPRPSPGPVRACGGLAVPVRAGGAGARTGSAPAPRPPQDLLFLGDFNADCNYVRERDWPSVRLRSSEVFKWLIPDSADTTVGNSDCAYDRIVACGARLRRSLKPQSAAVHDFQEEFGLDQAQASARREGG